MVHGLRSVRGACAACERALLRARQREGMALAKQRGVSQGRKQVLSADQGATCARGAAGAKQASLARACGSSRETLSQSLRTCAGPCMVVASRQCPNTHAARLADGRGVLGRAIHAAEGLLDTPLPDDLQRQEGSYAGAWEATHL